MSELSENQVTAALAFKMPQKVGWSVQLGDQSWTGSELRGLIGCLVQEENRRLVNLSLSIIFELTENEGRYGHLQGYPGGTNNA